VSGTEKVADGPACENAHDRAMNLLDTAPGRNRLAIASSIVLHLCALVVALLLPWPVIPTSTETGALPVAVTIAERPRPTAPPVPPALAPARGGPPAPTPTVHRHAPPPAAIHATHQASKPMAPVHTVTVRHELSRTVRTPAAQVAPVVVAAVANPEAAAPVTAAIAPATAATAAPPTTAAADGTTPAGGGGGGGNPGLFSATYPPAPAQTSALDAIRALLPARMRLRITVDENGHAAVVDWLSAPPDAALAGAIRAKLMALPYIPAECDGLPCTGIISLTT